MAENLEKSSKFNILFKWIVPEPLKTHLISHLKELTTLNLIFPSDKSEENLLKLASQAHVIIGWRPTEEILLAATQLRLFINPGVGVQHLIPLFRKIAKEGEREITLVNGHGNTFFTAQHAVALLLTLTNRIIPHHEWLKAGRWRTGDKEIKSIPLRKKIVGLLGYGHINQQVHRLLSSFPVNFAILRQSWDNMLFFHNLPSEFQRFTPEALTEFLKVVDILIIALPQTERTEGMIGERELNLLKSDSFLINISRGPIIDEQALYSTLKNHSIGGAAIDVWYEYSPEPDSAERKFPYHYPFHELDNIVLSPHRAASPFDNLDRWDEVIENLTRLSQNRTDFLNQVDLKKEY
ncbi:MAG: NAD(P)-dependent oxidoreductase [Promethearchaeota archaeon]